MWRFPLGTIELSDFPPGTFRDPPPPPPYYNLLYLPGHGSYELHPLWVLRSETVPEEKSQGKNKNFGALRAATRRGEEEKQEEKFFDSRTYDCSK